MSTWANVRNNVAVDVVTMNPFACFAPAVAELFVIVPDGTLVGSTYSDGVWTPPSAPGEPSPIYQPVQPIIFYLAFSPEERILIKASTDPVVIEMLQTLSFALSSGSNPPIWIDPNLPSIVNGLNYLATINRKPAGNYPAWAATTAYALGAEVAAGGNVYVATTEGTSGTTAPSGTGTGIIDGAVVWNFAPQTYLASSARIPQIQAGVPQ